MTPPSPARSPGPMPEIQLFTESPPSLWQRVQFPLRWLGLATLIGLAVFGFRALDLGQYLNQTAMRELIAPLGSWAPAAFIGVFVLAMLCMVIPYSALAGLSMLLFGLAWGMVWTVLGGTLAALCVWGLSKLIGRRMIAGRLQDPRWKNLNERLEKDGFYYLLLLRMLSIVPFNVLNFACAFTPIRLRDFLLANLIGLIPSAFVYGFGLKLLLDPNTPKPLLAAFVGVIALLLVTPMVFRQARKARRNRQRRRMLEAFEAPEL